jgi:uncharacterized protein (UPF0276 family)
VGSFHSIEQDFRCRAGSIPGLGLGLSVDIYSPDLFQLMRRCAAQGSQPGYLEIFRATNTAIRAVRQHFPAASLAYHGEGLWITQPDFSGTPFVEEEISEVASQLAVLRSPWLNHECATKQMAGYSFGTYLPPLYTAESARVVADNIASVQERMDGISRPEHEFGPLFLLELPPLTYFMAGMISIPQFFRIVTDLVPCGLVLDIGHLWTVYRYTAAGRQLSLEQFVERFLDEFPLERVIEIHVAGLARHESTVRREQAEVLPGWVDAHAAPIQAISWTMLEQVLNHPRLVNLRGVALEVDTKPIENIVVEFQDASARYSQMICRKMPDRSTTTDAIPLRTDRRIEQSHASDLDRQRLQEDYARYGRIASGQQPPTGPEWQGVMEDRAGLDRYVHDYLPYEILHWGGELTEMFPETCRALAGAGIALDGFVAWWFQAARPVDSSYDFFLLKIERLLAFVAERAPALQIQAQREADELRRAYAEANDAVQPMMEPAR